MKQQSSAPVKPRRNKLQSSLGLQKRLRSVTAVNFVRLCLMLALSSIASLTHAADIGTVEGQLYYGNMTLLDENRFLSWDGITMNGAGLTNAVTFYGGSSAATFIGGSGNDTFLAGAGSSTFTGGAGANTFAIIDGANNTGSHYVITDFDLDDTLEILGTISDFGHGSDGLTLTLSNGAKVTLPNLTDMSQLNGQLKLPGGGNATLNSGPAIAVTATGYVVLGGSTDATFQTPVGDFVNGTTLSRTIVAGDSVSGLAIKTDVDGVLVQTAAGDLMGCKAGTLALTSSGGIFTLFGTNNGQTVQAGTNTHTITGGAGNDTLIAGAGNDTLTGGPGIDILTGGLGTNRFVDTATNLNLDTITDLKFGDAIVITDVRFTALNYNGTNGVLQLDTGSDGSFATSIKLSPGLVGDFLATPSDPGSAAFTTVSLTQVAAVFPLATTLPATAIAATTATLNGTVNPGNGATAYFQYGLTTNYGSVTPPVTLSQGGALDFDGTDQFATTTSSVNLSNRSFSVEFWARRDGSNRWDMPLTQGTNDTDHGLHVGFRDANTFAFAFWSDDLDASADYSDNAWHHWACTYNQTNNQRFIYRDGIVIASDTASGPYLENSPLLIARSAQLDANFGGALDELRVWNGVRTPAQINAFLNTTVAGTETDLLAYWRFDEGTGASAGDSSGHGNTAALIGSPAWIGGIVQPGANAAVAGLAANTLYHFRVVASNSGITNFGSDLTFFTTASSQPVNFILNGAITLSGGTFQMSFTNLSGLPFTVLGTTNLGLPLSNWDVLGAPIESPPGEYQFTDSQATNTRASFYRVRSP